MYSYDVYIKIAMVTLLPVFSSVVFYLLNKRTAFGKLKEYVKQIVYGVVFGGLAILGTEWGVPVVGAQLNCRDAAVVTAGLMFGAPAGIIAGVIGGLERWFAVYWGIGSFTRVACSLSTFIAGVYAAILRKFMFEDKKPFWLISLASGIVIEVFHLTMVFITNMKTPNEAIAVVRACAVPMILANGISVMLSALALGLITKEAGIRRSTGTVRISQTIQRSLLLTVILAFLATSLFVYNLQNRIAVTQADELLEQALDEITADIHDTSDAEMLQVTEKIAKETIFHRLAEIIQEYDVSEICMINKDGIISQSTVPEHVGYDMASGEQSAEFLCLLGDTESYIQKYGPIAFDNATMLKYAGVKTQSGFVQVAYDASQLQAQIDEEVIGLTRNRHVGQTGYVLIMDEDFSVVSAPEGFDAASVKQIDRKKIPEENTTFQLNISGEKCYSRYVKSEGYFITSVLPITEAYRLRNIALYVNTFMEVLVFAILFGLVYMLIKRVVVDQMKKVNRSLSRITDGDLDVVVDVRTNAEFASLSDDINSTVDTLKHYIDEASARIDQELELAKNIQKSALPSVFPAFPKRKDFDIYATMDPAKEVGGDFYDFYMPQQDILDFLVADVSGKGIPAAMFMMRAKTELKSLTEAGMALNDVFTHGNEALCEGNDAGMFVTSWQGCLNLKTGLLQFANAGHNPPLVKSAATGKFEYLKGRPGFVLAGMDGVRYKLQELQLSPGDQVFLYTDGVTEATNANNELFGEERLLEAINARAFMDMRELCDHVKNAVDTFVDTAPQFDDITMVALNYIGEKPAPTIRFEKAEINDIPKVTEFIEEELEKLEVPMKAVIQINIAIDELYSNIVKYGYGKNPGPVEIKLIAKEDPRCVMIRFQDDGIPYNPLTKEDPDITLSAEERQIGGLGIYMVKKSMDEIKYKYEEDHNILTIKKLY